MSKKMRKLATICAVVALIVAVSGTAPANWSEDFDDMTFDETWAWERYPDLYGSFTAGTIVDAPGSNDYLKMEETVALSLGGAAFAGGFVNENFTDVRVGAVVGADGNANNYPYCYHGLLSRVSYIIDDGTLSGYPGVLADTYIMLIAWGEEASGDYPFGIELQKVRYNSHMMATPIELGLDIDVNRSYYAELDVVGSNPVYVTASLYEYKGGPLIARLPTMVDTDAQDWWEDATDAVGDPGGVKVLKEGLSGLTGFDEDEEPAGWSVTFDDVFSISDGPAAACISPADGATGVSVDADLSWLEAEFATSRELWFGKEGAMKKVVPAPAGTTYDPGTLDYGQTYQWRVDEIGSATVTGRIWSFTTELLIVDDFESYTTRSDLQVVWRDGYTGTPYANSGSNITVSTEIDPRTTGPDVPPDNPPGPIHEGSQAMQFAYDNDGIVTLYVPGYTPFTYGAPYYSEIEASTSGLGIRSNWTLEGIKALTLYIYGNADNVDEQMYLVLEDSDSNSVVKCEKVIYGGSLFDLNLKLEDWQEWNIDLDDFTDVDLTDVQKIYIGFGDRNNPQPGGAGVVYFDHILLYQPRCIPALRPAGDIAEPFDCKVNFLDVAVLAGGWLDEGLYP